MKRKQIWGGLQDKRRQGKKTAGRCRVAVERGGTEWDRNGSTQRCLSVEGSLPKILMWDLNILLLSSLWRHRTWFRLSVATYRLTNTVLWCFLVGRESLQGSTGTTVSTKPYQGCHQRASVTFTAFPVDDLQQIPLWWLACIAFLIRVYFLICLLALYRLNQNSFAFIFRIYIKMQWYRNGVRNKYTIEAQHQERQTRKRQTLYRFARLAPSVRSPYPSA